MIYLVGIIILVQLFNLQIVNGAEYRETSNTKLTREATIEASRGSILDRTGNVLVSTEMDFSLEMYKTKVEDSQLNDSILLMTNILENNGNDYVDPFPISIDPFEYHFENDEKLKDIKYDVTCGEVKSNGLEVDWDLTESTGECKITASYKLRKISKEFKIINFNTSEQ